MRQQPAVTYEQRHSRRACGPTACAQRFRAPECYSRTRTRQPE
ncbi:hypothetical protein D555_2008 [Bordetella holmesii 35009]|nr:hypothetical protein D555_2008 [Bordetella holmesii 35009]